MTKTTEVNINGVDTPVEQCSPEIQAMVAQADGFFNQLDNAQTQEEVAHICETHPHNQ